MNAFIIPNLTAETKYGAQIYLYLPEAKVTERRLQTNLGLYSPTDSKNPTSKIMALVDGEGREGWLNFYLFRFGDNQCHIFAFGRIHGKEIRQTAFAGRYAEGDEARPIERLKDMVEVYATNFQDLYLKNDVVGVAKGVMEIVNSKELAHL